MALNDRTLPKKEGHLDNDIDDEDQPSLPLFCAPSPSLSRPSLKYFRGIYLALVIVRFYFAFQTSYIHLDENFQGPEVMAGRFFKWPMRVPWEFKRTNPIRSIIPLWMVYYPPLTIANCAWKLLSVGNPPPWLVYTLFKVTMFLITFVLEDLALMKLLPSQSTRKQTLLLVASSYVTWVYQTHTFSNAVETVCVLWSLVFAKRIQSRQYNSEINCALFAAVAVFGTFTRITFPFWLVIPSLQLLPHFWRNPWSLVSAAISAFFMMAMNVFADTKYYSDIADTSGNPLGLTSVVLCPFNNFNYNSRYSNVARHGVHPRWLHFVANFFVLLGPAYLLIICSVVMKLFPRFQISGLFAFCNVRALAAFTGALLLSIVPHQEPRFLIPAVPLLLSCFHHRHFILRIFTIPWIVFNLSMGIGFGIYHQAGVFPAQASVPRLFYDISVPPHPGASLGTARIIWWMTPAPPHWLLGDVHAPYRPLPYDDIQIMRALTGASVGALHTLDKEVPRNATILPPLPSSGADGASSSSNAVVQQQQQQQQQQHSSSGPGSGVNGIRISYRDPIIVLTPRANPLVAPYIASSSLSSTPSYSVVNSFAPANSSRPLKKVDSDIEFHLLMYNPQHMLGLDKDAPESMLTQIHTLISQRGFDAWLVTRSQAKQQS